MPLTPSNKSIIFYSPYCLITIDVVFSHDRQKVLQRHCRRVAWLRSPKPKSQKGREELRKGTSLPVLWVPYLVAVGGILGVIMKI